MKKKIFALTLIVLLFNTESFAGTLTPVTCPDFGNLISKFDPQHGTKFMGAFLKEKHSNRWIECAYELVQNPKEPKKSLLKTTINLDGDWYGFSDRQVTSCKAKKNQVNECPLYYYPNGDAQKLNA